MRIALLNDTHCGVRNSSDIYIKYQEKFYEEVFFPYLLEHNIKNIIHLGDYFEHRRFINFKALNSNRKTFLNKLREYGITMDIIPGNHDVYHKNTIELNSLKELLGHYMNEVNIVMKPTVMDYDGTGIALIPWIAPENEKEIYTFIDKCKAEILGAHLELRGFDMSRGIPMVDGMDPSIFDKFEMVLSGHYHTKSSRDNIHYLGSQMEFTWADVQDPKYFHIFDTADRSLTPVRNPNILYNKISYDDTSGTNYGHMDLSFLNETYVKVIVVNKSDQAKFDFFIDRIQMQPIHDLKIAETFEEFSGSSVGDSDVNIEDTDTLLNSYIDAVETNLDKNVIKKYIHELLIKAQTMEV
jgi:DNA repair exonuclease SbcCD nuclease subunit